MGCLLEMGLVGVGQDMFAFGCHLLLLVLARCLGLPVFVSCRLCARLCWPSVGFVVASCFLCAASVFALCLLRDRSVLAVGLSSGGGGGGRGGGIWLSQRGTRGEGHGQRSSVVRVGSRGG